MKNEKKKVKLKFKKKSLSVLDDSQATSVKGGITGYICTTIGNTFTKTLFDCNITVACER